MNLKICKGLIVTADSMSKIMTEGMKAIDPENLMKTATDAQLDAMVVPDDDFAETEEGGIAYCRSYYDAIAFDGPFCCQFAGDSTSTLTENFDFEGFFVASDSVVAGEEVVIMEEKSFPHAIAFKDASRLSGLTAMAAAAMVWVM